MSVQKMMRVKKVDPKKTYEQIVEDARNKISQWDTKTLAMFLKTHDFPECSRIAETTKKTGSDLLNARRELNEWHLPRTRARKFLKLVDIVYDKPMHFAETTEAMSSNQFSKHKVASLTEQFEGYLTIVSPSESRHDTFNKTYCNETSSDPEDLYMDVAVSTSPQLPHSKKLQGVPSRVHKMYNSCWDMSDTTQLIPTPSREKFSTLRNHKMSKRSPKPHANDMGYPMPKANLQTPLLRTEDIEYTNLTSSGTKNGNRWLMSTDDSVDGRKQCSKKSSNWRKKLSTPKGLPESEDDYLRPIHLESSTLPGNSRRPLQEPPRPSSTRPFDVDSADAMWILDISRDDSQKLLAGRCNGTFLFRTTKVPNCVCTLVVVCNGSMNHINVRRNGDETVSLGMTLKDNETKFNGLKDVVEYFTHNKLKIVFDHASANVCFVIDADIYGP